MRVIFFLVIFLVVVSQKLMVPSPTHKNKFNNIYFPQSRTFYGVNLKYNIVYAPLLPNYNITTSPDICNLGKHLFSNLLVLRSVPRANFSCHNYFCSEEKPFHLQTNPPDYKKHYDVLTFCHLCRNGARFNFSLFDPVIEKRCNWTEHKQACPEGLGTDESICIPFIVRDRVKFPIGFYFFEKLNLYLAQKDFTHIYVLPAVDIHIPHTCTILFWAVFIFTVTFIAIPEVVVTILKVNSSQTFLTNLLSFFGFRMQSVFWVLASEGLAVGFFTMYSIEIFLGFRQKTLLISGLILTLFISLFAYLGFIALWIHIIETSDSIEPIQVRTRNK